MSRRWWLLPALLLLALAGGAPAAPGTTRAQSPYLWVNATVSPAQISTDTPAEITIVLADNTLAAVPQIRLFTCPNTGLAGAPAEATLSDVRLLDDHTLSATVPAGMSEGAYAIHIVVADDEIWIGSSALTLIRPSDGRPGPWRVTSSLLHARWQFSATVANSWIYVVGDQPGAHASSVEGAPIQPDGSLGPWQEQPPLRTPRARPAVVAAGGYLYAIGGFSAGIGTSGALGSSERAPLLAGGGLGPWEPVAHPPFIRGGAAATLVDDQVFLIGGVGRDDLRNSAYVADVLPAGGLGPWRTVEAPPLLSGDLLPNALVAVHNGLLYYLGSDHQIIYRSIFLYYLGGEDRMVYSTSVSSDGILAPWQPTEQSLGRHIGGGAAVVDGTLYVAGGFFSCIYGSNFVERSTISPDGFLSSWAPAASTTLGHGFGTMVASGETLYVIGGIHGFGGSMTGVEYARVGSLAPVQDRTPQIWLPAL